MGDGRVATNDQVEMADHRRGVHERGPSAGSSGGSMKRLYGKTFSKVRQLVKAGMLLKV